MKWTEISKINENRVITKDETITLYHGSKSGIHGEMEAVKGTAIYKTYSELVDQCDMMVGYIVNDRMFVVLDRFFNGEITDAALSNSLSALKLGKQYVALTPKACGQIKIIKETHIMENDRRILKYKSGMNRLKGVALAEEICRKYRREGRFFDEILEEME